MNGKKAKLLRKIAQGAGHPIQPTQYKVKEGSQRRRQFKNELGHVMATVVTSTVQIVAGTRHVYKKVKKMYNKSLRSNMRAVNA